MENLQQLLEQYERIQQDKIQNDIDPLVKTWKAFVHAYQTWQKHKDRMPHLREPLPQDWFGKS